MAAKKKSKKAKGNASGSKTDHPGASKANGHAAINGAGAASSADVAIPREGIERARYVEQLPVASELHEREHAGAELAALVDAAAALKAEKREVLADFRERAAGIQDRQNEFAGIFKGHKLADVEVVEILYVEACSVDVVRKDTGEVVRTRTATRDDLQEQLDAAMIDKALGKMTPATETAISKLDAAIAKSVAAMPPKGANPEDLAPAPGTLKGPDEVAAPSNTDGSAAPDGEGEEDEHDEDDPLGLGDQP
jgi:hypothetical protein